VGSGRSTGDLLEREIDRELVQVRWAQRVNISAKTGRAVQKLVPAGALSRWDGIGPPVERLIKKWSRLTAAGTRREATTHPVRHPGRARRRRSCAFSRLPEAGYRRFWSGGCARRRVRGQPDPHQRECAKRGLKRR
jgi:hypothetical protein